MCFQLGGEISDFVISKSLAGAWMWPNAKTAPLLQHKHKLKSPISQPPVKILTFPFSISTKAHFVLTNTTFYLIQIGQELTKLCILTHSVTLLYHGRWTGAWMWPRVRKRITIRQTYVGISYVRKRR